MDNANLKDQAQIIDIKNNSLINMQNDNSDDVYENVLIKMTKIIMKKDMIHGKK